MEPITHLSAEMVMGFVFYSPEKFLSFIMKTFISTKNKSDTLLRGVPYAVRRNVLVCSAVALLLQSACLQVYGQPSGQPVLEIPVRVVIECESTAHCDQLKSELLTELRGKTNIIITEEKPLFIVFANTADVKTSDGVSMGIALSTVLTKRIDKEGDNVSYEFLTSSVCSLSSSQIRSRCVEMVGKFDTKFFEPIRKKP